MKNTNTNKTEYIKGKIEIIERLQNSKNGNPRYIVKIGQDLLYTQPNSSIVYVLKELNRKQIEVVAEVGLYYRKYTLFNIVKVLEENKD